MLCFSVKIYFVPEPACFDLPKRVHWNIKALKVQDFSFISATKYTLHFTNHNTTT